MNSLAEGQARHIDKRVIARLRDQLIDHDILVDDSRADVDRAVEQFKTAVQRRDAIAEQLRQAIAHLEPAA
jgi:hypothetical protein